MGNSPPGSSYNDSGEGVPLVNGPVEFSPGPFGLTRKTKFTTAPTRYCEKGDLLICVRGSTTGRTNIADFDACIGRGVAAIQAKIDQHYLNHVILSMRNQIFDSGTGSTFPSISQKQLRTYLIAIPPLAEQKRIVAKVDELMALCDRLEEAQQKKRQVRVQLNQASLAPLTTSSSRSEVTSAWNRLCDQFQLLYNTPETLSDLRQTILQLAVQGKLVRQDPNDVPAEVLLEQLCGQKSKLIKENTIPKPKRVAPVNGDVPFSIPLNWKWERLGNLSHFIEAGWSPKCESYPRSGEGWGVLKISAVTWDEFDPKENKALPKHLDPRPHCEVRNGDFIMSRANTSELVAKSVVVNETPPRLMLNDKLLRVKFPKLISKKFVNLYNNGRFARDYYMAVASGTSVSMRNVSRDNVANLLVPVPPLAEQERIVNKMAQLQSLLDRLESTLTHREATRTQLLTAAIHAILNND